MYGIPSNYLNVVDTEFYLPTHLEENACVTVNADNTTTPAYLPDGKLNATAALFNNVSINEGLPNNQWPLGDLDIFNITTPRQSVSDDVFTTEIKVLMSENMRAMASINAGDTARLCNYSSCRDVYRLKVRGLLTKLPGFMFTAYKNPLLVP